MNDKHRVLTYELLIEADVDPELREKFWMNFGDEADVSTLENVRKVYDFLGWMLMNAILSDRMRGRAGIGRDEYVTHTREQEIYKSRMSAIGSETGASRRAEQNRFKNEMEELDEKLDQLQAGGLGTGDFYRSLYERRIHTHQIHLREMGFIAEREWDARLTEWMYAFNAEGPYSPTIEPKFNWGIYRTYKY